MANVREDPLTIESRVARAGCWGAAPEHALHLGERIVREVERRTGQPLPPAASRRGMLPRPPESRVGGALVEQLARIAPTTTDDDARVALTLGKSYPDLVAARQDTLPRACDVVVSPRTEEQLERALALLAEHDIAVVPVGGGTSVVGGIEPIGRTPGEPVAALDLAGLDACLDVDVVDRVATFQAGIRGPALERALTTYGLTLGHMPQSFELATLGGWIATRGAGQLSLGYGKIERTLGGVRMYTPDGAFEAHHLPAHGAGPDLCELVLGSEGTLGVIARATMRLAPRPEMVRLGTYVFPDFATAQDASRLLVQAGIPAAGVRVSDGAETAFSVASSAPGMLRGVLGRSLVRVLGLGQASMVFTIVAGDHATAARTDRAVDAHMRRCGARAVGPIPARHWYRSRFEQPYARDLMMDRGLLVDTLETAAPWSVIPDLHVRVRAALERELGEGRCVVGCHLSHLYRDGASAYFTFLTPAGAGAGLDRWRAAKRAVHEAIASCHAATSHQHGVGTMHAALWRESVPPGMPDAWQALRAQLDPGGRMNPGKLHAAPADGLPVINRVEGKGSGLSAGRRSSRGPSR